MRLGSKKRQTSGCHLVRGPALTTRFEMKVLFLDIDGVLLSGRAWALPDNAEPERLARAGQITDALRGVRFDPVAVALVNRLCSRSGAKLVCHSTWRMTYGRERTQQKLLEEGIDAAHLHPALCRTHGSQIDKWRDISLWLEANRVTPAPEWPQVIERFPFSRPYTRSEQRQIEQYERDLANTGIDYLVLDDDRMYESVPQIVIDPFEGLTVADYRVALGYFGCEDPGLGSYTVTQEDWARVVDALGSRIDAAEWLYRTMRSQRLKDTSVAAVRNSVWAELPKPRRRRLRRNQALL